MKTMNKVYTVYTANNYYKTIVIKIMPKGELLGFVNANFYGPDDVLCAIQTNSDHTHTSALLLQTK